MKEMYRPNVMVMVFNEKGEVLLCRRLDGKGWQQIQGGIHENESLPEAAARELYEEVGLKGYIATNAVSGLQKPPDKFQAILVAAPLHTNPPVYRYDFPPHSCQRLRAEGYIGQEQRCCAFFAPSTVSFNLSGLGGEKAEFSEVKWVPLTKNSVQKYCARSRQPVHDMCFSAAGSLVGNFLETLHKSSDSTPLTVAEAIRMKYNADLKNLEPPECDPPADKRHKTELRELSVLPPT